MTKWQVFASFSIARPSADEREHEALLALRKENYIVDAKMTWQGGEAARLTAEAVAEVHRGQIYCIVAGGSDGTINEVFAAAYAGNHGDRANGSEFR